MKSAFTDRSTISITSLLVIAWTLSLIAPNPPTASAQEIGFEETFALSDDRSAALKQLIPGTEAYYYYHCLHFQNTRQLDKVPGLLKSWIGRHGQTELVNEIEYRQALFMYEQEPSKTIEFIRRKLNLQLDHQRPTTDNSPQLASALDQDDISRDRFLSTAMQINQLTDQVEDSGLYQLLDETLTDERRRHLLERISIPDHPQLVDVIVDDLNNPKTGGFGSLAIHNKLTKAQLDELRESLPTLLENTLFVYAYLTQLLPNADIDLSRDHEQYGQYLERLSEFTEQLKPVFNSLKAQVLYRQLEFARTNGNYGRSLFMRYIAIPKRVGYVNAEYIRNLSQQNQIADLQLDLSNQLRLPPVANDQELVDEYLLHFFVDDDSYEAYQEFISESYLKRLFAEAKIVNGIGDQERWYALLTPTEYEELRNRVDIDFLPTNPKFFAANDAVSLQVAVKNVDKLIVKVFEINAENYYRANLREIGTDIDLDGLVSKDERVIESSEAPLRRLTQRLEFPELKEPGIYVIDLIGNGKSSRAIVRKGKLRFVSRNTIAGQAFRVFDENQSALANATIWMEGREYRADDNGQITLPYTNQPGRQAIIISHDGLSCLDYFDHQRETYSLEAGFYIDREQLLNRRTAKAIIRANLKLAGTPVHLKLLSDPVLTITSTDLEGVQTTSRITDFELRHIEETVIEFNVPERTTQIELNLTAKVKVASRGEEATLSQTHAFAFNQIDREPVIEDLHLLQLENGFALQLLGKTGEAITGRPVELQFKHRDFKMPIGKMLKTNGGGMIHLGALSGIASMTAQPSQGRQVSMEIPRPRQTYQGRIHVAAGESFRMPYVGEADNPNRDEFALLAVRDATYREDHFDKLSITSGQLVVAGLTPGDYELLVKPLSRSIQIRVTEGADVGDFILGSYRQLEKTHVDSLAIASTKLDESGLEIKTANYEPTSRVHLVATRFVPAYDVLDELAKVRDGFPLSMLAPAAQSLYVAGRKIGDEYQYILDRRYAEKYPGNMLERPALLLAPWAVRSTATERLDAAAGDDFAASNEPAASMADRAGAASSAEQQAADYSNLDFLGETSLVLSNLAPDESGVIKIEKELLDGFAMVRIVTVSTEGVGVHPLALNDPSFSARDLRLNDPLPADGHFAQQKTIEVLREGETLKVDDIKTSRVQSYSSLSDAYRLLSTLSNDATFKEFNFILEWPKKTEQEKRELYSKYACHELSFFLMKKDPEFFSQVVRPFLQNKFEKTFFDRWLLGEEVTKFSEPWKFDRMNIFEKIMLGQRLTGQRDAMRRHVADLSELKPVSRDDLELYFQWAIKSSSLDDKDRVQQLLMEVEDAEALELGSRLQPRSGLAGGGGGGEFGSNSDYFMESDSDGVAARGGRGRQRRNLALGRLAEKQQQIERGAMDKLSRGYNLSESMEEFDLDFAKREKMTQLYRVVEQTKEWAENNYYHVLHSSESPSRVNVNQYWLDYATHPQDEAFYSTHIAQAKTSFTEMMLALAILDLPFDAAEHLAEVKDDSLTIKASGPMLAYLERLQPVQLRSKGTNVLVSQNFYRLDDRYIQEAGQTRDRWVTDEFLTHVGYGCQVVVTNPTSSALRIDLLMQIPEGALPINGSKETSSKPIDLQPYSTASVEFSFYFPASGDYSHYPVHVSQAEELIAFANPFRFQVVDELSQIDKSSWAYVAQFGTDEMVLDYLRSHNVEATRLDMIAYRMKDKEFFQTVTQLLADRFAFDATLWAYSFLHEDAGKIRQFLAHTPNFIQKCGAYIDTPLLTIDPFARQQYEHLEYKPLINARAHQLGSKRQILNDRFYVQYGELLQILACQNELDDNAKLEVTYYLLLQDRIGEALTFFARINPDRIQSRMQYDYCSAYLDMFQSNPSMAATIAEQYKDYPVDRWREAFAAITAQLAELTGAQSQVVNDDSRDEQQTRIADQAPSIDFTIEANQIQLAYQNLDQVKVDFYLMDIELLFSRNPFVQANSDRFSFIQPNQQFSVELATDGQKHTIDIPEALRSKNVLVEISGAGVTKAEPYYSNSLAVQMLESMGQLRVTESASGKPLPTTYVKVYARMNNGEVRFYKDGYTDLRGRFDYGSLSTNELDSVDRFAILLISEEHGATVRESSPPQR